MPRPFLLLSLLILTGCTVATSRSNVVVLTETQSVIEGCTRLGVIDGASPLREILLIDQQRAAALGRLKTAAADLDGTHVLTPVAAIKWKGPDTTGTVYRCVR